MTEPMSVACPNCQTYPCSNPGCLKPLQAEIKRLEAIKAELLAALETHLEDHLSHSGEDELRAAIEKAKQ